jgi:hypothetical protein
MGYGATRSLERVAAAMGELEAAPIQFEAARDVAHDEAVRHLCDELNATETLFPGTDLRLIYKVGSC